MTGSQLPLPAWSDPRFPSGSSAVLSADRVYRYRLWRTWGRADRRCVFVGLNPSTADELTDDPTIRKCVGFAKQWSQQAGMEAFGAIDMVNLFAFRSTSPSGLRTTPDPVGPMNDGHLIHTFGAASRIVLCWGRHEGSARKLIDARIASPDWQTVWRAFGLIVGQRLACEVGVLGDRLPDGSPRHPLMPAYSTPFVTERTLGLP